MSATFFNMRRRAALAKAQAEQAKQAQPVTETAREPAEKPKRGKVKKDA